MACLHDKKFEGRVNVVRTAQGRFRVDVMVWCEDCGIKFRFYKPFISSTDGLELSAQVFPGPFKVNRPLPQEAIEQLAELT